LDDEKTPLNSTLFNIYVQELEEEMEKGQIEGVLNKQKTKFWTIMYADDIVLLARRKAELK